MYKIIRHYIDDDTLDRIIYTSLTKDEAKAHCKNPETSSSTCKGEVGLHRTRERGPWFDGYEEQ